MITLRLPGAGRPAFIVDAEVSSSERGPRHILGDDMSETGLAIFVVVAFIVPVPLLAWLADRLQR